MKRNLLLTLCCLAVTTAYGQLWELHDHPEIVTYTNAIGTEMLRMTQDRVAGPYVTRGHWNLVTTNVFGSNSEYSIVLTDTYKATVVTNGQTYKVYVPFNQRVLRQFDAAYAYCWPNYAVVGQSDNPDFSYNDWFAHNGDFPVYDYTALAVDAALTDPALSWEPLLTKRQLDDRWRLMTNLFLVPWGQFTYTDSKVCSDFTYTNVSPMPCGIGVVVGLSGAEFVDCLPLGTFPSVYTPGFDYCSFAETNYAASNWWFTLETLHCLPDLVIAGIPAISLCPGGGEDLTTPEAPHYRLNVYGRLYADANVYAYHDWCGGVPDPNCNGGWSVYAYDSTENTVRVTGSNVTSKILITNLWSGAEHRAHIYTKGPSSTEYTRAELTDWTFDPTITSTSNFTAAVDFNGVTNDTFQGGPWCAYTEQNCCGETNTEPWYHATLITDVYYECDTVLVNSETNITTSVITLTNGAIGCVADTNLTTTVTTVTDHYRYEYDGTGGMTNIYPSNIEYYVWLCDATNPLFTNITYALPPASPCPVDAVSIITNLSTQTVYVCTSYNGGVTGIVNTAYHETKYDGAARSDVFYVSTYSGTPDTTALGTYLPDGNNNEWTNSAGSYLAWNVDHYDIIGAVSTYFVYAVPGPSELPGNGQVYLSDRYPPQSAGIRYSAIYVPQTNMIKVNYYAWRNFVDRTNTYDTDFTVDFKVLVEYRYINQPTP